MKDLASRIRLTFKGLPLVFCGKTVSMSSSGAITVKQAEATRALEPANVPKNASKQLSEPLTPEEVTEMRRIIGSTLWIA
eukprot:4300500-Amphidinium_carterae.1